MGSKKSRNPLGFTAWPVTIITSAVYIALSVALLYTHHVVPSPPSETPMKGLNLTVAWHDLQVISEGFHPYNSRKSDAVRSSLLERINQILVANKAEYTVQGARDSALAGATSAANSSKSSPVIVFNDLLSNGTWSSPKANNSVYFEGNNIMVYIRGSRDGSNDWWNEGDEEDGAPTGAKRGVLVNAHFDSVSTGFGATDDGVGVVSVLQLIKYYTTPGHQPERGLVALLNNGEEDYLNGARAFMQHPISRFPDTFLNLEGAGAGGRAILFRSTDAEVTRAYQDSPYPFGTVVAGDAFNRGVVASQTDYVIFNGELGLRGLDVAFFEPRARYHTNEDSARFTSEKSIWHMLSAAVTTTRALTADTTTDYSRGKGNEGVWFDLMGRIFGLTALHTMFALSVSLLVVPPVIMMALAFILGRSGKYYLFARKGKSDPLDPNSPDDEVIVSFNGWRGLFRYPVAFVLASAAVVGLAYLVTKINPYIVYSSQYSVWAMMLCAWLVIVWFILRGADFVRPTALHRAHAFGWLFVGSWLALAADTVGENNFHIAGGYFLVIYFASIFLAFLISYLEFFALPTKEKYVRLVATINDPSRPVTSAADGADRAEGSDRTQRASASDAEDPTETTSLLGRKQTQYSGHRGQRSISPYNDEDDENYTPTINGKQAFGDEQGWSAPLPSWLWVLQFLLLGPITIVLVGQLGLFGISAMHQTLADGNSALAVYIFMAVVSILLLLPVSPFLHRFSFRLPTFLFAVFVGTLIYNLLAFPFSSQNQLKVFFQQEIDLTSGSSRVSLAGLDGYVQDIIATLPSAAGQTPQCEFGFRGNLMKCSWNGPKPHVVGSVTSSSQSQYRTWLSVNSTRLNNTENEAVFRVVGQNTRSCRLVFDEAIGDFDVDGAAPQDKRMVKMPDNGARELRLWSRTWEKPWTVHVRAQKEVGRGRKDAGPPERKSFEGKAVCIWSDANVEGTIPALDEVKKYMPIWATVTKGGDGLVEGYKRFKV